MADWFKFYENDLDETRFQYALHQLSEVCPVWVGILSECCRHKSDTIRWGSNEIELFGFSQRLNVSVPKVNEAIKLLVDIDYISKGENTLKVLKWNTKQSDYCSRIKRRSPNSVRTVSEQCSPRGEEKRIDQKREEQMLGIDDLSSEEVKDDSQWIELLQKSEAYKTLNVMAEYSKAEIWCQTHGKKMTRKRFIAWLNKADKPMQVNGNGNSHNPPNGAQLVSWNKELDRVQEKMDTIRSQYGDHQAWDMRDSTRYKELGERRRQLREWIGAKE